MKATRGSRTVVNTPASGRSKRPVAQSALLPLQRVDLVQEAAEQLRAQIISGQFGVDGPMPPEAQLGAALGVSRTVIREAMRTLAAQGLVEVSQGRPARVRPVDPQTVVDTFHTYLQREDHSLLDLVEVRQPLEAAIAALAAERATEADIESLEQSIETQESARLKNDQIEEDVRFHAILARSTGNPVFSLLLSAVVGLMRRSLNETLTRTGLHRSLAGHRNVLAAIRRRDPDAARKAMFNHLILAEHDLKESN